MKEFLIGGRKIDRVSRGGDKNCATLKYRMQSANSRRCLGEPVLTKASYEHVPAVHDIRFDKCDKLRVIVCVHRSLSGGSENADDP